MSKLALAFLYFLCYNYIHYIIIVLEVIADSGITSVFINDIGRNKMSNTNNNSGVKTFFTVIGLIIAGIAAYALWVNSHAFEGSFFGMTFQLPLETTEHYCNRRAEGFFTFDTKEYQKCKTEASTKNLRHSSLISRIMYLFTDSSNKTAITTSQAECMAKKVEAKLSDSQVDRFIGGTPIGDMIGTSESLILMNEMLMCIK